MTLTAELFNPDAAGAPFTGTGPFDVTEGADVLGCSAGTIADQGILGPETPSFFRVWTCTTGDKEGTFTARVDWAGGDFEFWDWATTESTGGFAGLQGQGEGQSEVLSDDENGVRWVDTYTGDIEYGS